LAKTAGFMAKKRLLSKRAKTRVGRTNEPNKSPLERRLFLESGKENLSNNESRGNWLRPRALRTKKARECERAKTGIGRTNEPFKSPLETRLFLESGKKNLGQ
jgi:hypothetical protein